MVIRAVTSLALALLLLPLSSRAEAQDFGRYSELIESAGEAFAGLTDRSTDDEREAAADAAENAVEWLTEFEASSDFSGLPSDQQESVLTDRHRWEYNIARQWLEMGRCSDAQDRLSTLLSDGIRDPELVPRVSAAFAEAATCANASTFGVITIGSTPHDAHVVIDGVAFGTAEIPHRLELGSHSLTLSAEGYVGVSTEFELSEPDQELALGPFVLAAEPIIVVTPEPLPEPVPQQSLLPSNVLLGTSGVLGATGLSLIVAGQRHQRLSNNPAEGQELADPDREARIVRNFRAVGVSSLIVAAAAATTGFVIRPSRERTISASAAIGPHFAGLTIQLQ